MAKEFKDIRKTFRLRSEEEVEQFERLRCAAPEDWWESDVIRHALFNAAPQLKLRRRKKRRPPPVKDHVMLAKIMGNLGPLNNNINQLARRANMGSWPEGDRLDDACYHIRQMRDMLRTALGYKPYTDREGGLSS